MKKNSAKSKLCFITYNRFPYVFFTILKMNYDNQVYFSNIKTKLMIDLNFENMFNLVFY